MGLLLSRKRDQEVVIDGDIRIKIAGISGNVVRLLIEAPKEVRIDRAEIDIERRIAPRLPHGGKVT